MSEAWPNPNPDPGPPLWPEWVEPPPDETLEPPPGEAFETPDPVSVTGVVEEWPLREGDVFGTYEPDNPRVHSGEVSAQEAAWVSLVQEQVGAVVTGFYDEDTASAVLAWRANHGVTVDDGEKWVDEVAWTQMMRFEKDEDEYVNDQTFPEV